MKDPNRVVLAGDWHGNTGWACHVVEQAAKLLADEEQKVILHAGDFGVWPGQAGRSYLDEVARVLWLHRIKLLFADGNHEWHPELIALREEELRKGNDGLVSIDREDNTTQSFTGLVPLDREDGGSPRIFWAPRGYRWTWHGKTWMALGGAVSVDAAMRVKGKSWWPEETFTGEQLKHATRPGKVHVMLTHDSPSAVRMSFGELPRAWDIMDVARSTAHREQLQSVVDKIKPEVLVHGHYHQSVRQTIEPYGTQVIGLDMDGVDGNYTLFDTRELKEIS